MSETQKAVAVKIENLTKTFRIPTESSNGIKQKLINLIKGKKGYREFTPLKDISLEINQGDFFGIVGRNGSGKSTLLKSIANIYTPTAGRVHVSGTLVPFIELGVGFNADLTGRENVFLNGALLGFSRSEMEAMYDDIVEFAEIGDFMDEKLKNYSSGMQVRLAFSIAIRADADILLLDEVLAVGDEAFQRKCYAYFAKLKKEKKTVILVTHSMDSVQQFCNKAALIDKGHDLTVGTPLEIAQIYRELNTPSVQKDHKSQAEHGGVDLSVEAKPTKNLINIDINIKPKINAEDVTAALVISRDNGEMVYRWVYDEKYDKKMTLRKGKPININIDIQNIFPDGKYSIRMAVRKLDRSFDYVFIDDVAGFEIASVNTGREFWKPEEKHTVKS